MNRELKTSSLPAAEGTYNMFIILLISIWNQCVFLWTATGTSVTYYQDASPNPALQGENHPQSTSVTKYGS